VQWRLKLPVPPTELRMSLVSLASSDGVRSMLAVVGLERALAELEAAFREIGVELGMITGQIFALAVSPAPGACLLVQQEQGFLSMLLTEDGVPRLIRTKHLASSGSLAEAVRRELSLTLGYIRETLGLPGDRRRVFAESPALGRDRGLACRPARRVGSCLDVARSSPPRRRSPARRGAHPAAVGGDRGEPR
jgi:hypothetical protein